MKFSLITPTLQRESLRKCCESVDSQSFTSWEHVIWVDGERQLEWITKLSPHRRTIIAPGVRYANFGNTPRHLAWSFTAGEYVLYLDDDNYLNDPNALSRLAGVLEVNNRPKFMIIPCLRFGGLFFIHPPGTCRTDSANMVIERSIAQWPNRNEYTLDGIFAEQLHAQYGSIAIAMDPVIVVPSQGKGE